MKRALLILAILLLPGIAFGQDIAGSNPITDLNAVGNGIRCV